MTGTRPWPAATLHAQLNTLRVLNSKNLADPHPQLLHWAEKLFGFRALSENSVWNKRLRGEQGRPMTSKSPQAVDVIVGRNIRLRRLSKGISQTELASKIGVTFQQVQKYEKGVNRVGASRLSRIAQVLNVPVAEFFDGGPGAETEDRSGESPLALLSEPQTLRLVKAFSKITESGVRRAMVVLLENLVRNQKTVRPRR